MTSYKEKETWKHEKENLRRKEITGFKKEKQDLIVATNQLKSKLDQAVHLLNAFFAGKSINKAATISKAKFIFTEIENTSARIKLQLKKIENSGVTK